MGLGLRRLFSCETAMCKSLNMIDCFLMKSGFLMKSEAVGIYKLHHNVKTSVSFAHYLKQTFCIGAVAR